MPFSRTSDYPNPFITLDIPTRLEGTYNYMTHVLLERAFWHPLREEINRFRKNCCSLPPLGLHEGATLYQQRKTPFLYCFSSALVPKPADWPDWVHLCGFWFLDQSSKNFSPDPDLVSFLNESEEKPLYVGFGSIVVENPEELAKMAIAAIEKSNERVILASGWSDFSLAKGRLNDKIFVTGSCPHDWLFTQVRGVCHHGGAGTTAAGLRAACPTMIISFFGDQPFWGQRVSQLGLGSTIPYSQLTVESFADGLVQLGSSVSMKLRAMEISTKLFAEDGPDVAIAALHRHVAAFDLVQPSNTTW